ncbi:MAG TPA: hypothetical protein VG347_10065 [Verrucomicrobiae bacterium]|nr:hypothetical protein [Verrucomicrobiae bacterium]
MLILGKHTDDVGAQLEKLTKCLLESRGFKNIITDTIGEGGNEIDVQAEFPSPVPGSPANRRLIAECKAYAKPISLPDWLKFLGKVFVEEAKLGNDVDGLFVALSGANGPVRGNFDSLRQRKQHITLLEGESLTEELSKLYSLPKAAEIIGKLKQFTDRQYSSMEIAYYDDQFYWVFIFLDNDAAVLDKAGEPVSAAALGELCAPLLKRLDAQKLLDLPAEKLAVERNRNSKKFLLTSLVSAGGKLPVAFIEIDQSGFTASELKTGLTQCNVNGWTLASTDGFVILSFSPTSQTENFFETLRFLLNDGIKKDDWVRLVGNKLFDELLNEQFLKQISLVQGNLPLDIDFAKKLRLLVKLSPSALACTIYPDPMIVTHRVNQPTIQNCDADDVHYLMLSLLRSLRKDFRNGILANYFYHDCALREIEVVEHYRVKDKSSVILEHDVKDRIVIGEAHESLGGGLVYLRALNNAPEPWDWAKPETASPTKPLGGVFKPQKRMI